MHNGMGHHTKITLARLKWNTAELHCTPCLHVLRQRVTGGQGAALEKSCLTSQGQQSTGIHECNLNKYLFILLSISGAG